VSSRWRSTRETKDSRFDGKRHGVVVRTYRDRMGPRLLFEVSTGQVPPASTSECSMPLRYAGTDRDLVVEVGPPPVIDEEDFRTLDFGRRRFRELPEKHTEDPPQDGLDSEKFPGSGASVVQTGLDRIPLEFVQGAAIDRRVGDPVRVVRG
jgi:hypothetical protein